MKKLFKGAIPTLALLLVAIMSLTSVTYAWFTFGSAATVDTIDVNVKSVDGLQISSVGKNGTWSSTMTPTGVAGKTLSEVSTIGKLGSNNKLEFFTLSGSDKIGYNEKVDAVTYAAAANAKDYSNTYDSWLEFPLYIKNDHTESIWVDLNGTTVSGTGFSEYASRIAIVQEGVANADFFNANGEYTFVDDYKVINILEPNADKHTTDGSTWIASNDKDNVASYLGVFAATDETDTNKVFYNAATGKKYVIVDDAKTTMALSAIAYGEFYSADSLPKDAEYYVFQAGVHSFGTTPNVTHDANHLDRLTIDDFFTKVAETTIMGDQNKLASGLEIYELANGKYTKLEPGVSVIVQGGNYYKKVSLGNEYDDIEDGKLVIFKSDNNAAATVADIALAENAEGITLADLTVKGKQAKALTYFVYNETGDDACYKTLALDLNEFFEASTYDRNSDGADESHWKAAITSGLYVKDTSGSNVKYVKVLNGATYNGDNVYTTKKSALDTATYINSVIDEAELLISNPFVTAVADYQALGNAKSNAATKIYTKNTTTGKYEEVTGQARTNISTDEADFVSGTYYVQTSSIALLYEETSEILKEVETVQVTNAKADNGKYFQFEIEPNKVVKYRVYVWIEGQDADCTNDIAGIPFQVDLVLNKKSAADTEGTV